MYPYNQHLKYYISLALYLYHSTSFISPTSTKPFLIKSSAIISNATLTIKEEQAFSGIYVPVSHLPSTISRLGWRALFSRQIFSLIACQFFVLKIDTRTPCTTTPNDFLTTTAEQYIVFTHDYSLSSTSLASIKVTCSSISLLFIRFTAMISNACLQLEAWNAITSLLPTTPATASLSFSSFSTTSIYQTLLALAAFSIYVYSPYRGGGSIFLIKGFPQLYQPCREPYLIRVLA